MAARRMLLGVSLVLAFILGALVKERSVKAQSISVLQVSGSYASHAACVVVPAQTTACLASDGVWVSLNGAAFAQVGAGTTGVTSFNGRTGAVVPVASDYPDAVTSVNGKTGAVVISATTSATTTLQ
jgi:hypothetical protein